MAINSVGLGGANTVRLDFDAGTAMADMVAAIVAEITSRGWAVFADVGPLEKVLVAPNKDAITSKLAWLDATDGAFIRLRAVEAWDTSTNTPVNPIDDTKGLSNDNSGRPFRAPAPDLSVAGAVFVSASPRWAMLYSGQDPVGPAEGIIVAERTREHPLDTPTGNQELPPVVWLATRDLEGIFSQAFPRYISGADWTTVPGNPEETYVRYGAAAVDPAIRDNLPGVGSTNGGRDPLSLQHFPLETVVGQVFGNQFSPILGRVFGIKGLAIGLGVNGDIIRPPVDGEFFLQSGGALADHIIFMTDVKNREEVTGFFRFCIPA